MSRDSRRSNYNRDGDFRHYNKNRGPSSKRSPPRHDDKHSLSHDRDLDENILREISKLPEPSEMWESNFNGPPPPPSFNHDYSGIYDDFPSALPSAPRPPDIVWNPQHQPPLVPAPAQPPPSNYSKVEDQIKKDAAIESEMRHQKAALSKQREDYMKKTNILKKELETLKDQRNELKGSDSKRSPSPDTKRFLKENTKLQLEIQNKLKTIHNVVDMLNSIIGEDAHKVSEPDEPVERTAPKRKSRSPGRCNYIYYDPEMHWCRICNEFPSTAKEYLNHLHTAAHHKTAAAHLEAPWHTVTGLNEGFPSYPSAPNKRTPIRGLQFFVPSTAWYCKLCDQFIGDLHCASAHLKSIIHSKNYSNFVEQNPHWETDWMSDRQKSFEKHHTKSKLDDKTNYSAHTITFCKDGFHTKKKEDSPPAVDERRRRDKKKNKKKRKSSSSSESDSDSSDSEPVRKKKTKRKKYDEDEKLKAWMSIQLDKLNDHDKKIIDSLKNRIKTTHESDIKRDLRRDEFNRNSRERVSRQREPSKERKEIRHKDREFKEAKRETREEREKPMPSAGAEKSETSEKKPEVKKMPFIGKMPVFKSLSKNKLDGKKKEEVERKKEDEVTDKKKREEIDAEIQKKAESSGGSKRTLSLSQTAKLCNKKVAEFREKINKAQLERMPPAILSPAELLPPPLAMQIPPPTIIRPIRPPPTPNPMNLQQDFQEALDIIFPSLENQKKNELKHESLFGPIPTALPHGFLNLPPGFPHPLVLPPGANPPPLMMGFDPMSHFRPQLYDNQVPMNNHHHQPPTQQQMQQQQMQHQHMQQQHLQQQLSQQQQQQQQQPPQKQKNQQQQKAVKNNKPDLTKPPPAKETVKETREGKNKAELDELAMLGIDASDVGACM